MIKRIVTLLIITCASIQVLAQVNRVRNGSFEQHKSCPRVLDQAHLAMYWTTVDTVHFPITSVNDTLSQAGCAPEYINACAIGNFDVGVPATASFYQYPRTGSGMMQVVMYANISFPFPEKRNYLTGRLVSNLLSGHNYCITFYVTFNGILHTKKLLYAVDHIGAYLDNGRVCKDTGANYCGQPHPEYIPQLYTTTIITDTVNWIKVQGSFVADGTEKFITIGNFFDSADVNFIQMPVPLSIAEPYAVYLVDDVSVIESTEIAHAGTDKTITAGDSVRIGTSEEGMPCTWYVAGDTTPVGYSGGIWVKPSTTTSYVVELDLCGNVTRDSVRVTVWPVNIEHVQMGKYADVQMWPNPATGALHVDGAPLGELTIADVVGRVLLRQRLQAIHEVIDMSGLPSGIYAVSVTGDGGSVVRKIVKE